MWDWFPPLPSRATLWFSPPADGCGYSMGAYQPDPKPSHEYSLAMSLVPAVIPGPCPVCLHGNENTQRLYRRGNSIFTLKTMSDLFEILQELWLQPYGRAQTVQYNHSISIYININCSEELTGTSAEKGETRIGERWNDFCEGAWCSSQSLCVGRSWKIFCLKIGETNLSSIIVLIHLSSHCVEWSTHVRWRSLVWDRRKNWETVFLLGVCIFGENKESQTSDWDYMFTIKFM